MFFKKVFERLAFNAHQNSPMLYFAAGLVGLAATGVAIWVARPKCDAIIEEYNAHTRDIEEALARIEEAKRKAEEAGEVYTGDDYTKKDALGDRIHFGMKAAVAFAKALWVPGALLIGTAGYFSASYLTNAGRIAQLGKAYARERARSSSLQAALASAAAGAGGTVLTTFDKDAKPVTVVGDDGEMVRREPVVIEPGSICDFFGPGYSLLSKGDPESDRYILQRIENQLTDQMKSRMVQPSMLHPRGLPGWVTLQEIRDALEIIGKDGSSRPHEYSSGIGCSCYPLDEDNKKYGCAGYVSFGIFNAKVTPDIERWRQGAEDTVLLTYNCDKYPLWGRDVFKKGIN